MKKIIILSIVILFMFISMPTFAGVNTLGKFGKLSLGIEVESVEREMVEGKGTDSEIDYDNGNVTTYHDSYDVPDCVLNSNRALLSLGIGLHPKLDLFIKAGFADTKLDNFRDEHIGYYDVTFDGDSSPAFGFGLKAELFEVGKFKFLANGEYLSYKVDNDITVDGEDYSDTAFGTLVYDSELEMV